MSGGYKTPPRDDADAIKKAHEAHSDAITILQRPTGEQLANILAKVTALVTNLIVPQVNSASATAFTLTTTSTSLSGFNFFTPAGCTKCLISAGGSVASLSGAPTTDALDAKVSINGTFGAEVPSYFNATAGGGSSAAVAVASLTGLTTGQAIPVLIYGRLNNGPGNTIASVASVAATALFLP